LRSDETITLLVNNPGAASFGTFVERDPNALDGLIDLNVVAVTRIANAAGAAFVKRGRGNILKIGSVIGVLPEYRSVV
jgi:short-subunit dehydrogenase